MQEQYWRSDPVDRRSARSPPRSRQQRAPSLGPRGEQWEWPALRSNGSRFTARTLALYFLHDIRHHLWDVTA